MGSADVVTNSVDLLRLGDGDPFTNPAGVSTYVRGSGYPDLPAPPLAFPGSAYKGQPAPPSLPHANQYRDRQYGPSSSTQMFGRPQAHTSHYQDHGQHHLPTHVPGMYPQASSFNQLHVPSTRIMNQGVPPGFFQPSQAASLSSRPLITTKPPHQPLQNPSTQTTSMNNRRPSRTPVHDPASQSTSEVIKVPPPPTPPSEPWSASEWSSLDSPEFNPWACEKNFDGMNPEELKKAMEKFTPDEMKQYRFWTRRQKAVQPAPPEPTDAEKGKAKQPAELKPKPEEMEAGDVKAALKRYTPEEMAQYRRWVKQEKVEKKKRGEGH